MKLTAITTDNQKVILTGLKTVNGKEYISFQNAEKNEFYSFDSGLTTVDGQPIVREMFQSSINDQKNFEIKKMKEIVLSVNDKMNRHTSYQLACSILEKIDTDNSFINSLVNSFFDNRMSEKQAFFLAKFIVENKL